MYSSLWEKWLLSSLFPSGQLGCIRAQKTIMNSCELHLWVLPKAMTGLRTIIQLKKHQTSSIPNLASRAFCGQNHRFSWGQTESAKQCPGTSRTIRHPCSDQGMTSSLSLTMSRSGLSRVYSSGLYFLGPCVIASIWPAKQHFEPYRWISWMLVSRTLTPSLRSTKIFLLEATSSRVWIKIGLQPI